MRMSTTACACLLSALITRAAGVAHAQSEPPPDAPVPSPDPDPPAEQAPRASEAEPPSEAPEDAGKVAARDAFLDGIAQAKKARWSEALASFERSAKHRPLAVTTYNVAASLRALGHYVRAKKAFERSLAQDGDGDFGELGATLREDTRAFIGEIDGLLAHATITLEPASAAITIDGRPLEPTGAGRVLFAGTQPPGPGSPPPAKTFEVLLDPGTHVFTLRRRGYADAVVRRSFDPGQKTDLALTIDKLPAALKIGASEERAIVTVDGRDVGQTPVELSRREGRYKVSVFKEGFVPYETTVALQPGQRMNLRADLAVEEPALYEEWWFWTAVGAGVAAAAVTTYFVVRPDPQPPAPSCGGLNWCIDLL